MKKIALFLVLILVLSSAGCGSSENIAKSISTPANIDGFQRANFDKFNSPASENGLGGTKIYIDGILEDVDIIKDTNILYGVLNDSVGKWNVNISLEGKKFIKTAELLEGVSVRIFGVYAGFSSKFDRPTVDLIKLTKLETAESFHALEYMSLYSAAYDGFIEGIISSAKELNSKDYITENEDNFVKKIENKCQENIVLLGSDTIDNITEYIYEIKDKDITLSIEKNNKMSEFTKVHILFANELNEQIYCAVVQTFDTKMSSKDAIDIYNYLMDNTIKVDNGDFAMLKKGSCKYSLLTKGESIDIIISKL